MLNFEFYTIPFYSIFCILRTKCKNTEYEYSNTSGNLQQVLEYLLVVPDSAVQCGMAHDDIWHCWGAVPMRIAL